MKASTHKEISLNHIFVSNILGYIQLVKTLGKDRKCGKKNRADLTMVIRAGRFIHDWIEKDHHEFW